MTNSRWKVMAGVLGVSLGGLAAIAGQCPKTDGTQTRRLDDTPFSVEAPRVPSAGSGSKPALPVIELPAPVLANTPAAPTTQPADPLLLPSVPPPASVPVLPVVNESKPVEMKLPVSAPALPVIPVSGTTTQVPEFAPQVPPPVVLPTGPEPTLPSTNPPVVAPPIEFTKPTPQPTPPLVVAPAAPPVAVTPSTPPMVVEPSTPGPVTPPAATIQPISANVAPPVAIATAATKFRIILRVGEGEPMFEVRSGDDLVMKVVCEKVDIKSPEKGQSLSAVTASGKVRFVGFGAEGTCESLSFLAGTGEVSMNGAVKIQVKDKLGRVESELTTETIKYKLDASALPGVLKP